MDRLKLVAADIDATLCGRKTGTLGPITKQALIDLHASLRLTYRKILYPF